MMQRVHPEDLVGYLLETEREDWELISLPVIIDQQSLDIAKKYGVDTGDLKVGDPMWGFKMNHEEIEKERKKALMKGSTYFETQFMQNPQPKEGLCFAKNELQYLDNIGFDRMMELPGIDIFYADTADEGSDYYSMPMARS